MGDDCRKEDFVQDQELYTRIPVVKEVKKHIIHCVAAQEEKESKQTESK